MIAVMNGDALGITKTATTVSVSFSILPRVLVSTTLALWVLRTRLQMTYLICLVRSLEIAVRAWERRVWGNSEFLCKVQKEKYKLKKRQNKKLSFLGCNTLRTSPPSREKDLPSFEACGTCYLSVGSSKASLVAQMVKNLPEMQETRVPSLDQEDPLEKGMATHSNILSWWIPMSRGAWRATVLGVTKSQTQQSTYHLHFSKAKQSKRAIFKALLELRCYRKFTLGRRDCGLRSAEKRLRNAGVRFDLLSLKLRKLELKSVF